MRNNQTHALLVIGHQFKKYPKRVSPEEKPVIVRPVNELANVLDLRYFLKNGKRRQ